MNLMNLIEFIGFTNTSLHIYKLIEEQVNEVDTVDIERNNSKLIC